MSNTSHPSLMVFLGSPGALQEFSNPDFLHPRFFIHCTKREDCTHILTSHDNRVDKMDIFLPHTAVDLIYFYRNLQCPRKRFHLYCETDDLVTEYKELVPSTVRDQVYNVNQIQGKLYRRSHVHLLSCINHLDKRAEEGDVDAADLLVPIAELFAQNAAYINEEIRQRSGLPVQPTEHEEG
jgi:hypothetical protein